MTRLQPRYGGRADLVSRPSGWDDGLPPVDIAAGEICVVRIALDGATGVENLLHSLLSVEEQARAAAFRVAGARVQFVVTRGVLRLLLGRCLDQPPTTVPLVTTAAGKPFVAGLADHLRFNVSHCATHAVLAVARDREVGVDIEVVTAAGCPPEVVREALSASERAAWCAASPKRRIALFFEAWTRKEALVKAVGTGFAVAPNQFAIRLGPIPTPLDLGPPPDFAAGSRWNLVDLPDTPGCTAALVFASKAGEVDQIRTWHLTHDAVVAAATSMLPEARHHWGTVSSESAGRGRGEWADG